MADTPNLDGVYDVLSHPVRRTLLHWLADGDSLAMSRVVADLAQFESNGADRTRSVRVSLFHNHLPKMRDARIVEYDSETIEPAENAELARRVLNGGPGSE